MSILKEKHFQIKVANTLQFSDNPLANRQELKGLLFDTYSSEAIDKLFDKGTNNTRDLVLRTKFNAARSTGKISEAGNLARLIQLKNFNKI